MTAVKIFKATKEVSENIHLKQSKLKKNRMQSKNDAIQNYTIGLVDHSLRKDKRKATAEKRRANSK